MAFNPILSALFGMEEAQAAGPDMLAKIKMLSARDPVKKEVKKGPLSANKTASLATTPAAAPAKPAAQADSTTLQKKADETFGVKPPKGGSASVKEMEPYILGGKEAKAAGITAGMLRGFFAGPNTPSESREIDSLENLRNQLEERFTAQRESPFNLGDTSALHRILDPLTGKQVAKAYKAPASLADQSKSLAEFSKAIADIKGQQSTAGLGFLKEVVQPGGLVTTTGVNNPHFNPNKPYGQYSERDFKRDIVNLGKDAGGFQTQVLNMEKFLPEFNKADISPRSWKAAMSGIPATRFGAGLYDKNIDRLLPKLQDLVALKIRLQSGLAVTDKERAFITEAAGFSWSTDEHQFKQNMRDFINSQMSEIGNEIEKYPPDVQAEWEKQIKFPIRERLKQVSSTEERPSNDRAKKLKQEAAKIRGGR